MKAQKYVRILFEFERLKSGKILIVDEIANNFDVDKRTVHRDILDLKCYMQDNLVFNGNAIGSIIYDRDLGGYLIIDLA